MAPQPEYTPAMGRCRSLVGALALLLTVGYAAEGTLPPPPPPSETAYEHLCDAIMALSQKASRLHNSGNKTGAEALMVLVEEKYAAAVAMYPSEAQAHANMATSSLNSQRWEAAVRYFELTLKHLPPGTAAQMTEHFRDRLRFAKLRAVGTRRTAAYRDGQVRSSRVLFLLKSQSLTHTLGC